MKCFAVIAVAAIGMATACADNNTTRARAPTSPTSPTSPANTTGAAVSTTPGVETPKSSTSASPTASMSTTPGAAVVNDRDPPDRIPASR